MGARPRDRSIAILLALSVHAATFVYIAPNISVKASESGPGGPRIGLTFSELAPAKIATASKAIQSTNTTQSSETATTKAPPTAAAAPMPQTVATSLAKAASIKTTTVPVSTVQSASIQEASARTLIPTAQPSAAITATATSVSISETKPPKQAQSKKSAAPLPPKLPQSVMAKAPIVVESRRPPPRLPPRRPASLKDREPIQQTNQKPQPKATQTKIAQPITAPSPGNTIKVSAAAASTTSAQATSDNSQSERRGSKGAANGSGRATELAALHDSDADLDARRAYALKIRALLEREKQYPRRAKARGRQGVVMAAFTVNRAGAVSSAQVKQSSGVSALDRETLAMLKRADLPPIPSTIRGHQLTFVMPVAFSSH